MNKEKNHDKKSKILTENTAALHWVQTTIALAIQPWFNVKDLLKLKVTGLFDNVKNDLRNF